MTIRGVFVTGTDTNIGKTVAAACLVARWRAAYWKPAQTGVPEDVADSDTIAALTGVRPLPCRHVFAAPLSVETAAALEGRTVALEDFALPAVRGPLVVEGAGGVLVPLNASTMMADLMRHLGLPVVLVARTGLGTINHTLLSLEALRRRGIAVAGVLFNGPPNAGNRDAVARHGAVRILGEIPPLPRLDARAIEEACRALPDFDTVCPP